MDGRTNGRTDGRMNGRTHDGHNTMTIARWPSASGAKKNFKLYPAKSKLFKTTLKYFNGLSGNGRDSVDSKAAAERALEVQTAPTFVNADLILHSSQNKSMIANTTIRDSRSGLELLLFLGLFSPTILKNILCLYLQDL